MKKRTATQILIFGVLVVGVAALRFQKNNNPPETTLASASTSISEINLSVPNTRNRNKATTRVDRKLTTNTQTSTGTATLELATIGDATDVLTTSPLTEISGKTLFHDGSIAAHVPIVAASMSRHYQLRAMARTQSDSSGNYTFMVPVQGVETHLLAQLAGFAIVDEHIPTALSMPGPPAALHKDLTLYPVQQISGTVTDSQGRPIVSAEVTASPVYVNPQQPKNNQVYQNYNTVLTDARGNFVFDKLPPWETIVYASKPGYLLESQKVPAHATGVNLVLSTGGSFITGQVLDFNTSEPVKDSAVIMARMGGGTYPKMLRYTCDSAGRYNAGPLQSGKYLTNVDAEGHVLVGGQAMLDIGDDVSSTGINLLVHTGHSITGHVTHLETGKPVAGATVYARFKIEPGFPIASTITDENGFYNIKNVGMIGGSGPTITAAAPALRTFQEQEGHSDTWLTVMATQGTPHLIQDIRMIGEAHVSGIVKNELGNPVPFTQVSVSSGADDLPTNGQKTVFTKKDGSYSIPVAAPATNIRLQASKDETPGYSDPLTFVPGEKITADITITHRP